MTKTICGGDIVNDSWRLDFGGTQVKSALSEWAWAIEKSADAVISTNLDQAVDVIGSYSHQLAAYCGIAISAPGTADWGRNISWWLIEIPFVLKSP